MVGSASSKGTFISNGRLKRRDRNTVGVTKHARVIDWFLLTCQIMKVSDAWNRRAPKQGVLLFQGKAGEDRVT